MDLSSEYQATFEAAQARARQLLKEGDARGAAGEFARCAHALTQLAGYARSDGLRDQRLERARRFEARAAELRSSGHVRAPTRVATGAQTAGTEAPAGEGSELTARVRGLVREAKVAWSDIAGLEDAKSQIRSLFAIALAAKPEGVTIDEQPNILLYGPPGTGKTLLAAAASHGLDATFYSIKAGDLLSKYFGESPQLVGRLYTEAKRTSPSVVFLDEVESLSPDRDSAGGVSGPEARILSQFLAELDGLDTKSSDALVITIAATNKPWLLDDAVLSRFARQVFVDLPDREARRTMFTIGIQGAGFTSEAPFEELAGMTDGLSGREITQACHEATRAMLVRANPGLEDRVDERAEAIRKYRLQTLPVTRDEFRNALSRIRPVTDDAALRAYVQWQGSARHES